MSQAQPPLDEALRPTRAPLVPQEKLADLLRKYREQGNVEGYFRATSDVLMSLVAITEDYLAKDPDASDELRPLIYGFVEYLDQRIRGLSNQQGFVEGGLGI